MSITHIATFLSRKVLCPDPVHFHNDVESFIWGGGEEFTEGCWKISICFGSKEKNPSQGLFSLLTVHP